MGNTIPSQGIPNNKKVKIKGCSYSQEHVPKEMKRYGDMAVAVQTTKLEQSRSNAPTVYVTRVYFPQSKHYDTFLTKDLVVLD